MKIIAANMKSNLPNLPLHEFFAALDPKIPQKNRVFFFPPAPFLKQNLKNITIGAQNAFPAESGAFTGEITAQILKNIGVKTVMIGHSERRALGEKDDFLAQKFDFFARENFNIIFCIGEDFLARKNGHTNEILARELQKIDKNYPQLFIAYEPVWAIGHAAADPKTIEKTHDFLKNLTGGAKILYGGSVTEQNAAQILKISVVDGVLVGGTCLFLEKITEIIEISQKF